MKQRELGSPFGRLLRQYRLAAGLTQEALAERARVSAQGVSALERGLRSTPQRETLELLADALDLGPQDRAALAASAARPSQPRAPRTSRPADTGRGALPVTFTSLHGREDEITGLVAALPEQRLITLSGTGGVGKTRIAIEAARIAADKFADGVAFVELGAIGEGALVAHRTAEAIGAPLDASHLPDAIVAALRSRHLLLILDTCEHVLASVAELVEAILERTEHVHVLLTSRQAAGIAGEVVRRVVSLGETHAVALFATRARAASDAFRLTDDNASQVVEICRRLDGIPLAIELVAPMVTMLSAAEIAGMLRNRLRVIVTPRGRTQKRQQTMEAVLNWSYELLDDRARTLFRRLGVFADGWSLERCRSVCNDETFPTWDVFDALGRLVAASLVVTEERDGVMHFRLLDSTRAYAAELLERSGELPTVYERLAEAVAADVVAARALWDAMDDRAWQRTLTADRETIRALMAHTAATGNAAHPCLRLLVAIPDPGLVFDRREIQRWYDQAANFATCVADVSLEAAYARGRATVYALGQAPAELVCSLARAAVDASRMVGDATGLLEALRLHGNALRRLGRLDASSIAFTEGLPLIDCARATAAKASFFSDWAKRDLRAGDVDKAVERLEQCLAIARPGCISYANALATLAECAFSMGNITMARSCVSRAAIAFRELNLGVYCAVACCNATAYAIADDDFSAAEVAVTEALEVLHEIGITYYVAVAIEHIAVIAALRGRDDVALPILGFTRTAVAAVTTAREPTEQHGYARAMAAIERRIGSEQLKRKLSDFSFVDERRALELAHLALQTETL
jgi:predicted ATPase/transcriptional regulator with XRE-family HTH domain